MNNKRTVVGLLALALAGMAFAVWADAAGPIESKLDPESEKFLKSARLIMSGMESKIWKLLPDAESRKEFIRDFWEKRDPDPTTPENEFKTEFENRIAYANKRFLEGGPGMNTDRGRIYIFMGPPDKFEEFQNNTVDSSNRGALIWWSYFDNALAVEFIDEKGDGRYRISRYVGDFFGAMELFKLGQWVGPDSVFKKREVKFGLAYDAAAKEIVVTFPAKALLLREAEDGAFRVDLDFVFYVYEDEGAKREVYSESKSFATRDVEYEKAGDVPFRFARPLKPGKNFVDAIVKGREGSKGKVRKIFEIKVGR
jgi:GWxTD domain-containing protein